MSREGPIGCGDDADAAALLGEPAPALPNLRWLDGRMRDSQSLEGRIVVIRNFTNECPFCASTLPTLQRLHERYGERGVTVLGVYHPKPPAPTEPADVAAFTRSLGVTFPVAVDDDWRLFRGWWTPRGERSWTSITWVLDGSGRFRWVHPGGEYHLEGGSAHERCRSDYAALTRAIDALLEESSAK